MSEMINGRTPEEIKQGLRCDVPCSDCAYQRCALEDDNGCAPYVERDTLAYIERLEAAQPKWIGVKERLPEQYQHVIVYVRHTEKWRKHSKPEEEWHVVEEDCWLGDGWECNADTYIHEVTHWMPLPSAPEGE